MALLPYFVVGPDHPGDPTVLMVDGAVVVRVPNLETLAHHQAVVAYSGGDIDLKRVSQPVWGGLLNQALQLG